MRRISHAVDPEEMRCLLESPPRACIAFVNAGMAELVPVELCFREGRYWIGLSGGESDPAPGPDQRLKLLVDAGTYYFDMHGIWIGGRALFGEGRPEGGSPALKWFQLVPEKFIAWDFAAMRKVKTQ